MNSELFEGLLYEEESPGLDFKKEQYRFAKASETEKSELLKDILGFANAWRRSEAYVLIGVEDVRGGRANVVGIPAANHLDDHSIQQFVNNLTNQAVRFHYQAFGFEGKQVGIISIEEQTRPVYLKKDYGKLAKEKVYIRRGSSTDPTKPASLEEIAQMRVGSGQPTAELRVEFARVERDEGLGARLSYDAEYCEMPAAQEIPDLTPGRSAGPLGIFDPRFYDLSNRPNDDFFRELADYEFSRRLLRPVRFVITNVGSVAAGSVRAELSISTNIRAMVVEEFEMPDRPTKRREFGGSLKGIRPPFFPRDPGCVDIDKNGERFRIEIDCGDLQPGRRIWSKVLYIGKEESGDVSLEGKMFAGNLPRPTAFVLTLSAAVTKTSMSVDELCSLA